MKKQKKEKKVTNLIKSNTYKNGKQNTRTRYNVSTVYFKYNQIAMDRYQSNDADFCGLQFFLEFANSSW